MTTIIYYLIGAFVLPYAIYWVFRRIGRGRIIRGGKWEIKKSLTTNAFYGKVKLNGHAFSAMFDTGATHTTIGFNDARRIGINPNDFVVSKKADTAGGTISVYDTVIDLFEVGPIQVQNMEILINRTEDSGVLVGMNFFDNLESFEIKKNRLILHGESKSKKDVSQDSNSVNRNLITCPYCNQKMRLPAGKVGSVICVSCEKKIDADTTLNIDQ